MKDVTDAWVAGLPKVELHVHVEGAILPETLMKLARRNSVALPDSIEALRAWYQFTDFPHFAEIYQTFSKAIVSAEDIYDMAWDFLTEQARQNILHTEATFTASTHYRNNGIPFREQMDAIRAAAERACTTYGVSLGLIIDIPREYETPAEAVQIARWVAEAHGDGLVAALGLAGYEPGFPPEMFVDAFALAKDAGVPAVIHAGETGPADYIVTSIEMLHARRIGHGVAALKDQRAMALIRERGVTLEVCPSSNLCLKVAETLEQHPFRRMDQAGLNVTINSDDPPMFNTDLNGEYLKVARTFGYDRSELKAFAARAAAAALLPEARKADIVQAIATYPVDQS
jgi:adenosine deaminase